MDYEGFIFSTNNFGGAFLRDVILGVGARCVLYCLDVNPSKIIALSFEALEGVQ